MTEIYESALGAGTGLLSMIRAALVPAGAALVAAGAALGSPRPPRLRPRPPSSGSPVLSSPAGLSAPAPPPPPRWRRPPRSRGGLFSLSPASAAAATDTCCGGTGPAAGGFCCCSLADCCMVPLARMDPPDRADSEATSIAFCPMCTLSPPLPPRFRRRRSLSRPGRPDTFSSRGGSEGLLSADADSLLDCFLTTFEEPPLLSTDVTKSALADDDTPAFDRSL
mmetsp:Transcript_6447/g.8997  ORF Transcript_6447/g.8997 Transcript_6447/m.8997 type:complete len:223 (+) Transcript_6447:793-1461(+)